MAQALSKARLVERPTRLLEKLGFVRDAVKTILDISEMVADVSTLKVTTTTLRPPSGAPYRQSRTWFMQESMDGMSMAEF